MKPEGQRTDRGMREADGEKHDLPRSRFKSEDHKWRDKGRGGSDRGERREDQCGDNS